MNDITSYECPQELVKILANATYRNWLRGRAQNLRDRDEPTKICNQVTTLHYYEAIHAAVVEAVKIKTYASDAPGAPAGPRGRT